jgi:hypothetical protein
VSPSKRQRSLTTFHQRVPQVSLETWEPDPPNDRTQAATATVLCSQRIASSICRGLRPHSEARSSMDSRALNLEATTEVEMPVPAITGLPKPTAGLIWISLGPFCVLSIKESCRTGTPVGRSARKHVSH